MPNRMNDRVKLFLLVQVSSWAFDLGLPLSLTLQVGGEGGGVKFRNSLSVNALYTSVYSHIWQLSSFRAPKLWFCPRVQLVHEDTDVTSLEWNVNKNSMSLDVSLIYNLYIYYYILCIIMYVVLWLSLFCGSCIYYKPVHKDKTQIGFFYLTAFTICLIQYTFLSVPIFFTRKWTKHENTLKFAIFIWYWNDCWLLVLRCTKH